MYRTFADAVKVPVLANITEFGATPLFTVEELRAAGVGHGAVSAVGIPRDEPGGAERLHDAAPRRHAEERRRHDADARGAVRLPRLPRLRAEARRSCSPRKSGTSEQQSAVHDRRTAPKPKKSVALSGVPPATPRCAPSAAPATTCTTAATTSSTSPRRCEFEEIAYLLVHGKLPNRAELAAYKTKLKALRGLPGAVSRQRWSAFPRRAHPMDVMRTGVLGARLRAAREGRPQRRRGARHRRPADGLASARCCSTGTTTAHNGRRIEVETDDDSIGGHFLHLLHGKSPPTSCGCARCTPRSSSTPSTSSTPRPSPRA